MVVSRRLTLSLPRFGILAMLAALSAPLPAAAQENFSANKTPAQLFQSDCTGAGCHKSAAGLAKSTIGLAGFLREHYTNSRESAAALAAYLSGQAGAAAPSERPGRGEPAAPRPPRNATRTPPAGEEAKPDEAQGPLTPARPRRAAPGATPATPPAGENPPAIVRPEPGAAPTPAAAQPRTPPQRGRPQHTATPAPEPAPAAVPAPPPPPPPVVHDIFD